MAILIAVTLKAGEKMICEECDREILEGETIILVLDWWRNEAEGVYCSDCKEKE